LRKKVVDIETKDLKAAFQKKDQIQKLLADLESLRAAGSVTLERYGPLRSDYQREMEAVISEIAGIKKQILDKSQSAKQNLNLAKTDLQNLQAAYNAGTISLAQLHKREEKINRLIREYRARIDALQSLQDARSSAQIATEVIPAEAQVRQRMWPAWAIITVIVAPVLLITGGFWFWALSTNTAPQSAAKSENVTVPSEQVTATAAPEPKEILPSNIVDAVEVVKPSVVFIVNRSHGGDYGYYSGSGTVIDQRGYILTNEHVIHDASYVHVYIPENGQVRMTRDDYYDATIISSDDHADIAIIKIAPGKKPLKPIRLGSSSSIRDGEDVAAIGYPFPDNMSTETSDSTSIGSPTVTRGSVSAHREMKGVDYIQTDTAFNHGNSGGALINSRGELVGIPTMFLKLEDAQNMNFAVAIDFAKPLIDKELSK